MSVTLEKTFQDFKNLQAAEFEKKHPQQEVFQIFIQEQWDIKEYAQHLVKFITLCNRNLSSGGRLQEIQHVYDRYISVDGDDVSLTTEKAAAFFYDFFSHPHCFCITCQFFKLEDIEKMLAVNPALVNQADGGGRTPLELACYNNRPNVVSLLLKNGADSTINNNRALLTAIRDGFFYIAELLITDKNINAILTHHNPQSGAEGLLQSTPLMVASAQGHLALVKFLLKMGADATINKHGALRMACEKSFLDIVKLLANDENINKTVNDNLYTPLMIACETRNRALIKLLLKMGADPSVDKGFAILMVCEFDLQLAKELYDACSACAFEQKYLDLALHVACRDNKIESVRFLLEKGAETLFGKDSALGVACENGYLDIVELLVNDGNINKMIGDAQYTPLVIAWKQGKTELMELLLVKGADPSQLNEIQELSEIKEF